MHPAASPHVPELRILHELRLAQLEGSTRLAGGGSCAWRRGACSTTWTAVNLKSLVISALTLGTAAGLDSSGRRRALHCSSDGFLRDFHSGGNVSYATAGLDASGQHREPRAVAWSLQRYLIFAILSCVPDRQRTLRELRVGTTLVKEGDMCVLWFPGILGRLCNNSLPTNCCQHEHEALL